MIQFFSVALRNMKTVGTVCPSSPMLSRALAEVVDAAPQPRRILEVGPGTGPVTREILRKLGPRDVLDIINDWEGALKKIYGPEVNIKEAK